MPNSFDQEGRGPSNGRLLISGAVFFVIVATSITLLLAKSRGELDPFVRVSAELVNVGDGLPEKSDVKFRGVLVGFVSDVVPAEPGRTNIVHINLKPEYASGIPASVTARVVPSNVFAVSSVQLVGDGKKSGPVRAGAVIREDHSLPTVLFQTTLDKFRKVLNAIGRDPNGDTVGWLTALGEATHGRGENLQDAGHDLNEVVDQLNGVVTDGPGPSTISALTAATSGLRDTAPELLDALDKVVQPMRTLAEKQAALTNLLSGGLGTVGSLGDAYDHQADRMIDLAGKFTPVVGLIADRADTLKAITHRLETLVTTLMDEAWNYQTNQLEANAIISLTPTRTYVRADCPRYGDLAGPSCFTAPEVPTAPDLSTALGSQGFPMPPGVSENRPNFAPPRGSVLPPEAYAPLPPPDAPPPVPTETETPPLLPAEMPPPQPTAAPQAAVIGGNVGPVGSRQEKDQLNTMVDGQANAAMEILFAPLVRGTTVHIASNAGGER